MISALLLALLAQSPIYIRNDGGYVGMARDGVDCYGVTCSQSGSRLRIQGSAGSSGVTPTGICLDGGNALGWDGGAYACVDVVKAGSCSAGQFVTAVSTSGVPTCSNVNGSGGWVQVSECIFQDAGSYPLDAGDAVYGNTLCNQGWRLREGGNTVTRPDLVFGAGIVIRPTQTQDIWNSTMDAPHFTIPLTTLYPSLTYETPIRLTLYATGNFSANYDQVNVGVWANGAPVNRSWLKAAVGAPISGGKYSPAISNGNMVSISFQSNQTPDLVQLVWPGGIAGGSGGASVGWWDGGWPAQSTMQPTGQLHVGLLLAGGSVTVIKPFAVSGGTMSSYEIFLACMRAGSATSLTCNLRGFKLEVQP